MKYITKVTSDILKATKYQRMIFYLVVLKKGVNNKTGGEYMGL